MSDTPHNLPPHLQAALLRDEPETLEARLELIQLKFEIEVYRCKREFQNAYYEWAKRVSSSILANIGKQRTKGGHHGTA